MPREKWRMRRRHLGEGRRTVAREKWAGKRWWFSGCTTMNLAVAVVVAVGVVVGVAGGVVVAMAACGSAPAVGRRRGLLVLGVVRGPGARARE